MSRIRSRKPSPSKRAARRPSVSKAREADVAWHDFLKRVEDARGELDFRQTPPGAPEEALFRGHRNNDYRLLPVLQQHCAAWKMDIEAMQDLESDLFFEFQARAAHLQPDVADDWEILFLMRHYGMATRLLDWTGILGVAVFFALRRATPQDIPHIWILNPYLLNSQNKDSRVRDFIAPKYINEEESYSDMLVNYNPTGMGWGLPFAIYPLTRWNARLHAQRGYFTIHGDKNAPLDRLMPKCVRRVDIPQEALRGGRDFLDVAGINDYSLFPDLQGLTSDIHRTNGILVSDPHAKPQPGLPRAGRP
jgi:hypothetical protein